MLLFARESQVSRLISCNVHNKIQNELQEIYLETLYGDDVVVGQIEHLEVVQLGHLEHAHQLVLANRKLKRQRVNAWLEYLFGLQVGFLVR